jgi:Cytidylyltransferase-like
MKDTQQIETDVPSELPPMAHKRAAVVVGRFQPPTKGHYKVISGVKKFIRQHPELKLEASPIVVVIGGSKSDEDKKRNPLSVEERMLFMRSSGHADGVRFFTATDAFKAFELLRTEGYEPVAVAAGQDRLKAYEHILDKFFKGPGDKPIKHYAISLERAKDSIVTKDDDAVDQTLEGGKDSGEFKTEEISGSLARRAVELGYEPEFAKIVGLEDKPKLAKKMFDKIKASL